MQRCAINVCMWHCVRLWAKILGQILSFWWGPGSPGLHHCWCDAAKNFVCYSSMTVQQLIINTYIIIKSTCSVCCILLIAQWFKAVNSDIVNRGLIHSERLLAASGGAPGQYNANASAAISLHTGLHIQAVDSDNAYYTWSKNTCILIAELKKKASVFKVSF